MKLYFIYIRLSGYTRSLAKCDSFNPPNHSLSRFRIFGGGSQMCAFRMEICNTPQNIIMLESVFVEWELKCFFFPIDDQSKSFRHLQYVRSWDYICTKGYVTFWWKHLDFIESTTPILLSLIACKKKTDNGNRITSRLKLLLEVLKIFAWS